MICTFNLCEILYLQCQFMLNYIQLNVILLNIFEFSQYIFLLEYKLKIYEENADEFPFLQTEIG